MTIRIYYIQCLACRHKVPLKSLNIDSPVIKMNHISDYAERIFLNKFRGRFVCNKCKTRGKIKLFCKNKNSPQINNSKSEKRNSRRPKNKSIKRTPSSNVAICISCRKKISNSRLRVDPKAIRCHSCQSEMESLVGHTRQINEGIAGTREDNKKMRGQVWSDVRNRRI